MMVGPYQLVRRYLPLVQGLTLVVLAVVGIAQFVSLREQLYDGVRRQTSERLEERVRSWEDQFLDRLRAALVATAQQSANPEATEEHLRDQISYLESIVLWEPAAPSPRRGSLGAPRPRILYPVAMGGGDRLYQREHPCITAAQPLQFAAQPNPDQLVEAYLVGCADAEVGVRLEASIEAARVLERAGRLDDAAEALRAAALPGDLTLSGGLRIGVLPDRLIVHRNRRAELLMARGAEQEALDLYYETGQQIADLSPADAIGLETWRWAVLDELRQHDRSLQEQRLKQEFKALDRRIRAYNEVKNQLAPEATALGSREPRLVRDQYVDRSYLLYYGIVERSSGGRIGVALQLDQQRVLANFLATSRSDREDMVLLDASGRWVMGKRAGAGDITVRVPFARTLNHLRVGVYDELLQRRMATVQRQWIVPLVFTAVVLLIGIVALSIQITYARSREELLNRQREFTTRVTHELKTPLAGIRVMAENLELGAFRDDDGRRTMASRIVDESDRLTQRIDELLHFTRRRAVPPPEVIDVEELIFDLVDVWGPRLEQHGVRLRADIDDAPQVSGDPSAVRDAIGGLLDNALKYRDPKKPEPQVTIQLGREGRDAVIKVTDNGLGVPTAMRKTIFDRFVRVEGPNRGMSGGHGLGLAQVAATAARHQGSVTCSDGVDGGSTFTLKLRGLPEPR